MQKEQAASPLPSTKRQHITEAAEQLGTFTSKDIRDVTGISANTVYNYLHQLQKRGRIRISATIEGINHYCWNTDVPWPEKDIKPATSSSSCSAPKRRYIITELTEALEWLLKRNEELESENQSLYAALCRYGSAASAAQRRYENRLAAIIKNGKERKDDK